MRILTGFFFVSLKALLLDLASGSKCQSLNTTLFKSCVQAGFGNSSALNSNTQEHLSSLISNMQEKFNCSSLSDLMTCSLHIPQCPATKLLPCKDTCKKFLTDCGNTSTESDGLKALFRGLCEVLPSTNCTSKSNHSNDAGKDNFNVTCHKIVLKQCQNIGYSYTSVTSDYQKLVNSSTILQQVDGNSIKLLKVICMELAPPCDNRSKELQVPCKSLCNDAFKESRSQFVKAFKDKDYCLAFPNATKRGQELCQLQRWPENVYWPSGLWMSLEMSGQQKKKSTMSTVPSSPSITEPKTPNLTKYQTTRTLNTLKPSTYAPTSSAITDTTAPNSTSSPSITVTTPATSNNKAMSSAPTTETHKPSLSSEATTPTTSRNEVNSTSASTKAAKPLPSTKVAVPSTSTIKTTLPVPSPSTKVTTPASPSNKPSPHVSNTQGTTPPTSTKEKTSTPAAKVTTPSLSPTPASSTKGTTTDPSSNVSASKGVKMSGGTIAGIAVGVIVLIIAIAAGVVYFRRFHQIKSQYRHSIMVDMDEL